MSIQAPFGAIFRPHAAGDEFLLASRTIYLSFCLPVMSQSVAFRTFSPNTLCQESEISQVHTRGEKRHRCFHVYSSHVLPPRSPVFMFAAISSSAQTCSLAHTCMSNSTRAPPSLLIRSDVPLLPQTTVTLALSEKRCVVNTIKSAVLSTSHNLWLLSFLWFNGECSNPASRVSVANLQMRDYHVSLNCCYELHNSTVRWASVHAGWCHQNSLCFQKSTRQ